MSNLCFEFDIPTKDYYGIDQQLSGWCSNLPYIVCPAPPNDGEWYDIEPKFPQFDMGYMNTTTNRMVSLDPITHRRDKSCEHYSLSVIYEPRLSPDYYTEFDTGYFNVSSNDPVVLRRLSTVNLTDGTSLNSYGDLVTGSPKRTFLRASCRLPVGQYSYQHYADEPSYAESTYATARGTVSIDIDRESSLILRKTLIENRSPFWWNEKYISKYTGARNIGWYMTPIETLKVTRIRASSTWAYDLTVHVKSTVKYFTVSGSQETEQPSHDFEYDIIVPALPLLPPDSWDFVGKIKDSFLNYLPNIIYEPDASTLQNLYSQLLSDDSETNWIENAKQGIPFIGAVKALVPLYEAMATGDPIALTKAVAGLYLAYSYDLRASSDDFADLLKDEGMATRIHEDLNGASILDRRASLHIPGPTPMDSDVRLQAKLVLSAKSSLSKIWTLIRDIGLDPTLSRGWDLVPFSFVADWFVPIGTYLQHFDNKVRMVLGYKSVYTTYSFSYTRTLPDNFLGIRSFASQYALDVSSISPVEIYVRRALPADQIPPMRIINTPNPGQLGLTQALQGGALTISLLL